MSEIKILDFQAIAEGRAAPHASARLLGWSYVGFDPATGRLSCRFAPKEAFLNPVGIVQGGILASMLDETMGPVVAAVAGRPIFAQTLEMKVNFMRGARLGPIFGEGCIAHRGRQILFLEGSLKDAEGRILATATATARARELDAPA